MATSIAERPNSVRTEFRRHETRRHAYCENPVRTPPAVRDWRRDGYCESVRIELPSRGVKGISIKLPEPTLRRLRDEARATGRSVAAIVRERVEAGRGDEARSVFALTSDLAGSVRGSRQSATNARRKFRRG